MFNDVCLFSSFVCLFVVVAICACVRFVCFLSFFVRPFTAIGNDDDERLIDGPDVQPARLHERARLRRAHTVTSRERAPKFSDTK